MLGELVRDRITGFEGTAVAKTEYLHGNARICVEPKVGKEGEARRAEWFDDGRLGLVIGHCDAAQIEAMCCDPVQCKDDPFKAKVAGLSVDQRVSLMQLSIASCGGTKAFRAMVNEIFPS